MTHGRQDGSLGFSARPRALVPAGRRSDDTPHRPTLLTVVKRVSLSLLIAVVVPAVLFYGVFVLAGVWTAIVAALAWSYGAILWRAVTRRRTSGLLILAAILLTGRTLLSVVADSTWLYFLQPIISDGAVAALFLLSLASARPMVARLARLLPDEPRAGDAAAGPAALPQPDDPVGGAGTGQGDGHPVAVAVPAPRDVRPRQSVLMLAVNVLAAFATIALAALVARQEGLLGPQLAPATTPA